MSTIKPELSQEEKIAEAIKDLSDAMLENLRAGEAETKAQNRKRKAHYNLLKAKERMYSLERELVSPIYSITTK